MTVHELHKINLPCDGKRSQGLAGERFKSWSEITFSLFFPPPTEAHEVFTSRFYPPPHYRPHCRCLITLPSLQSDKRWGANNFFPTLPRIILQSSACPSHSHWCEEHWCCTCGKSRDLHLFAAQCSLDILVETQIKNVKIMARLCFRKHCGAS